MSREGRKTFPAKRKPVGQRRHDIMDEHPLAFARGNRSAIHAAAQQSAAQAQPGGDAGGFEVSSSLDRIPPRNPNDLDGWGP